MDNLINSIASALEIQSGIAKMDDSKIEYARSKAYANAAVIVRNMYREHVRKANALLNSIKNPDKEFDKRFEALLGSLGLDAKKIMK